MESHFNLRYPALPLLRVYQIRAEKSTTYYNKKASSSSSNNRVPHVIRNATVITPSQALGICFHKLT